MNGVGPQFIIKADTLAQSRLFQKREANTVPPTAVTGSPPLAAAPRRRPAAAAATFPGLRKYDAWMQRLAAWRVFLGQQQRRCDLSNGAQKTLEALSSSAAKLEDPTAEQVSGLFAAAEKILISKKEGLENVARYASMLSVANNGDSVSPRTIRQALRPFGADTANKQTADGGAKRELVRNRSGQPLYLTGEPRDGQGHLPIDSLSWFKRKGVLKAYDPIHNLGLTNSSVFYRAMKAERVTDDMIQGNPKSRATIKNYMVLTKNDFGNFFRDCVYIPKTVKAFRLPDPSINVMYGTEAFSAASRYAKGDSVVVKMTLGDIRQATGGKVKIFFDTGAVVEGPTNTALIVAVPEGCKIPVQVVGPA